MPRASVTAKIASISFMETTSSTDARLVGHGADLAPCLVVDRHPRRAALTLVARLRLAGNQDLLGAGGQRRRPYPRHQVGDLRVKVRQRQEARGIEADDQRAVAEY